jgi:hypothetical protein
MLGVDQISQLFEKVGGGLRQWRNALILVAPDRDLWSRAQEAMREVMAYESVLDRAAKAAVDLSPNEKKDLESRAKEKRDSLRTSIVTAYRWIFSPDEKGLSTVSLPVPATSSETIARRVYDRLADQNYSNPKVMDTVGAIYFNSKIAPQLWKDQTTPLDLGEAFRRFPQWTFLPILPRREETLRSCIREGIELEFWAVALGDNKTSTYTTLIESPIDLDKLQTLFDGSASLVKGDLIGLIREQLGISTDGPAPKLPGENDDVTYAPGEPAAGGKVSDVIPAPAKRLTHLRITLDQLPIAKSGNLQQYLFRILQNQDAGSTVNVSIDIHSAAGIPQEVLEKQIVEAFEQLNLSIKWEPA